MESTIELLFRRSKGWLYEGNLSRLARTGCLELSGLNRHYHRKIHFWLHVEIIIPAKVACFSEMFSTNKQACLSRIIFPFNCIIPAKRAKIDVYGMREAFKQPFLFRVIFTWANMQVSGLQKVSDEIKRQ